MEILENRSLQSFNSFKIDVAAKFFAKIHSREEFLALSETKVFQKEKRLILGGGSNILFTKDFDGLIVKNEIKGIKLIKESDDHVWVRVGSGENWHEFVIQCLENRWYGLENLSLIPGTVGAAPVQNIGAYGVELKEFFHSLIAIDISDGRELFFDRQDCEFGYRQSVFKNKWKDRVLITDVVLRLNKNAHVNISYKALENHIIEKGIKNVTPEIVSEAVIAVRKSKLPDPEEIGNGGSFFKNPVVEKGIFIELRKKYADMPSFVNDETTIKIPAGWLIEKCGWKGRSMGNAGVHKQQALVLINPGNATGEEILNLSLKIRESIFEKFQITLEPEVNII